jgi:hypothetical protein
MPRRIRVPGRIVLCSRRILTGTPRVKASDKTLKLYSDFIGRFRFSLAKRVNRNLPQFAQQLCCHGGSIPTGTLRLTCKRTSRNEHHLYNASEAPAKQKDDCNAGSSSFRAADVQHLYRHGWSRLECGEFVVEYRQQLRTKIHSLLKAEGEIHANGLRRSRQSYCS